MPKIDWSTIKINRKDQQAILDIVKRAGDQNLIPYWLTPMGLTMDLEATHANGNPLRLKDLLGADAFNFAHDVCGIMAHMDRQTGELKGFFEPRFTDYKKLRKERVTK